MAIQQQVTGLRNRLQKHAVIACHADRCVVHGRCASLDGDADRLVYFTQQEGVFQLFDGDRIAVLAALLVRDILTDLPLPPDAIKVRPFAPISPIFS